MALMQVARPRPSLVSVEIMVNRLISAEKGLVEPWDEWEEAVLRHYRDDCRESLELMLNAVFRDFHCYRWPDRD